MRPKIWSNSFFTNQESVVPRRDLAINLVELGGNAVAEFNDEEQSKGVWWRAEDFRQERRRSLVVVHQMMV